jgi:hypothetical protein
MPGPQPTTDAARPAVSTSLGPKSQDTLPSPHRMLVMKGSGMLPPPRPPSPRDVPMSPTTTRMHMKRPYRRLEAPQPDVPGDIPLQPTVPRKKARTVEIPASLPNQPLEPFTPDDDLGTLVSKLVDLYHQCDSWEQYFQAVKGPSLISAEVSTLPHPAAEYLAKLH